LAIRWNPPYVDAVRGIGSLGFEAVELIILDVESFDYYTPKTIAELRAIMNGEGLELSQFVYSSPGISSSDAYTGVHQDSESAATCADVPQPPGGSARPLCPVDERARLCCGALTVLVARLLVALVLHRERSKVDPLRLGLLGAARITEQAVVIPSPLVGVRLVAIGASDPRRAHAFASRHGVDRVVRSYDELVADQEVEAVYNALPNAMHAPWNSAAIAARKHVLSEKPFASNAEEAKDVRDAGTKAGVVVTEGFHYLYHPVTKRVHELIASGELGEVQRVEVVMVNTPVPLDDPRWSFHLAGGALMDLGCYSLHANRMVSPWVGGEPEVVAVRGAEHPDRPGVDMWVDVDLRFPSGAVGSARCNMAGRATELTYRITGSGGEAFVPNFILPNVDDRVVVTTPRGTRVEHLGTRSSYSYQLEAFVAAVRIGTPMPTNADDAVTNMQMIDTCYRALGMEPRRRLPGGAVDFRTMSSG
jgi:predicted dehydrogenase